MFLCRNLKEGIFTLVMCGHPADNTAVKTLLYAFSVAYQLVVTAEYTHFAHMQRRVATNFSITMKPSLYVKHLADGMYCRGRSLLFFPARILTGGKTKNG